MFSPLFLSNSLFIPFSAAFAYSVSVLGHYCERLAALTNIFYLISNKDAKVCVSLEHFKSFLKQFGYPKSKICEPPQILSNSTFAALNSHALLSIRFRKKEKNMYFTGLSGGRTNHTRKKTRASVNGRRLFLYGGGGRLYRIVFS